MDPAFEFEKRRNKPLKYQRELWSKTIEAMKRVEMIKQKRQDHYIMQRLRKGGVMERDRDMKEVARHMSLIRSPAAGLRKKNKAKVVVEEMKDSDEEEEQAQESEESEAEMMEAN